MSDYIRDSITGFYGSIRESYAVLEENTARIEDRKGELLRLLQSTIHIPELPGGAGEYQKICRGVLQNVELQLRKWQDFMQLQIERSEFVNRHEKSILAIVFADVNAGKSSLGNFVSGYYLQNTAYADLYQKPVCEIEDFSKASKENRLEREIDHFPEDAVEATSTIQHYTLEQGLTWVDTPGLHSLTAEHGDLAKEYIQFADLVIFLTPSSSPFKSDEREMLQELLEQGKAILLAVTKSDVSEPDVVDGKIVRRLCPKSPENRAAQERFVMEETATLCGNKKQLENSHSLSLSVALARKAVQAQDGQMYRDSNLDGFFSQMGSVLSTKAIELKMRRPKTEVNTFISRLIGQAGEQTEFLTIRQLAGELKQKADDLEALMNNSEIEKNKILSQLEQRLPLTLSLLFRELRDRNQLGDASAVSREMAARVTALAVETCLEHFQKLWQTGKLSLNLPSLEIDSSAGGGYEVQYMEKIIPYEVERAPKGFVEKVWHFIDNDKKFYTTETRTEYIKSSDNFSGFLSEKLDAIRPDMQGYVSATIDRMTDACIRPLINCYQELDKQLGGLENELLKLRFSEL